MALASAVTGLQKQAYMCAYIKPVEQISEPLMTCDLNILDTRYSSFVKTKLRSLGRNVTAHQTGIVDIMTDIAASYDFSLKCNQVDLKHFFTIFLPPRKERRRSRSAQSRRGI
jgi:hypothetical protein